MATDRLAYAEDNGEYEYAAAIEGHQPLLAVVGSIASQYRIIYATPLTVYGLRILMAVRAACYVIRRTAVS